MARDKSTYRSAKRNRAHELKKEAADVGMKMTMKAARAAVERSTPTKATPRRKR
jgi:hypothetical protein